MVNSVINDAQTKYLCFLYVIFQKESAVEKEKSFQTFPPNLLIRKQASELPEGVNPGEKEVCVHVCLLKKRDSRREKTVTAVGDHRLLKQHCCASRLRETVAETQ